MLQITTDTISVTIDDDDDPELYGQLYDTITQLEWWKVTCVIASEVHLTRVLDAFGNIPRPIYTPAGQLFIWVGDAAKTIVANVLNELYNSSSLVIKTIEDHNDHYSRRSSTS